MWYKVFFLPLMAKLSMGQGVKGVFLGGYFSKFSKRLKPVLMVFKMLNEGYFEMFYQKELKNSDILGKIPFIIKISKISNSKFPKKSVFFTQNTTAFRLFLMKYHKIYLLVSVFLLFCMIFVDFGLASSFASPKS